MNLEKYIRQIKQMKPMEAGFMYNATTWSKLSEHHKFLIRDFEGKMITRADVIKAYKKYYNHGIDIVIPFLLTMVWGFADTGYGTHRTNNYISNFENLDWIKQGIDAVKKEEIKEAFKSLKKIKGLGVSYITKVLYFASKGANLKNYALIYDIRVASSLIRLTTPKEIFEIVSVSPSSKYENIKRYNSLLQQQAKKYNVEADAIELFLYEQKFS